MLGVWRAGVKMNKGGGGGGGRCWGRREQTRRSCEKRQHSVELQPHPGRTEHYSEWKVFNMKTDKIPNEILQSDMVGTVRHDCCCSSLSSGVRPQLKCGSQEGTLDL